MTYAREDVLKFYQKLPFNANESPDKAAELIKKVNSVKVTAVDFNLVAIKMAKETSELLGVDVDYICTSINQYGEISNVKELFEAEKKLYDVGKERLQDSQYYPGFFYVLGERR